MAPPRVLLCAPDRPDRALLAAALDGRGARVAVFDPRSFPAGATLGVTEPATPDPAVTDTDVTAAWVDVGGLVGAGLPPLDPDDRTTCSAAAETLLVAWLAGLDTVQVDPHPVRLHADDKVGQLRAARAVGLDVPATLVTNDARRVHDFAVTHPVLVTKMLVQHGSGTDVVFTTALEAADLDRLDGLDLCPMIFQERVPSIAEVRATVVGDEVLAAAIERREDEPDWRKVAYAGGTPSTWAPCALPRDVADRLLALTRALGLSYGAADLVVRPDGGHTFLEINARGSFAYLGDPVAPRIADTVARLLASGGRP